MENQQLSDVKGKELVAAGHAFAKAIGMDTPLIEIAKMVSVLATRLDCALVRGDELQKERDALAAENVALAAAFTEDVTTDATDVFSDTVVINHDWDESGSWSYVDNETEVIRAVLDVIRPETPATVAYLNAVRADGVDKAIAHLHKKFEGSGHIGVPVMALESLAAQLRAGKDGE